MRTKKKKKFILRLFLLIFLLLLFLLGGYYFLSLPIWKIREIVVEGTQILSANEIKELCGISLTDNLFLTDFSRTRNNLSKISAIKSFQIYRIPPATILIKIVERKPLAVVILGKRSVIIGQDGYILNQNPNLTLNIPNLSDLPVISGIDPAQVIEQSRINPTVTQLISEMILNFSNVFEAHRIQLELGGMEKISFLLDDLLRVKIGRNENIKKKMEVFEALLPTISGNWPQVEYIDVRYPSNPVIKYR